MHSQKDSTIIKKQKKIISQLSGHTPLENGKTISSRGSSVVRQMAQEYMFEQISALGLEPEYQTYKMPNVNPLVDLLFDPFVGTNVYAVLPATTPSDAYLVIGGHLDTELSCPGAIDNASGVVISYGVLSKLMQLKRRKLNVILVFFDQEEEDLVGSQAFAKKLKKEGYSVHSVHTLDTMGWDRDGDKAIELELPTEQLKNLYTNAGKKLGVPIYTTKVNSTDHHSFRELGFNATGLTDELLNGDYAPYKDTERDTFDTVNFEYVSSCTELVYEVFKTIIN